jgi:chromosomal replication initiator protein
MRSQQSLIQVSEGGEFDGVPASMLGWCGQCGGEARRSELREFDGRTLCGSCFQVILTAAQVTMQGVGLDMHEPDRLCSKCRAMVDPTVGSVWCSVLELGPKRATLCDNFVPLETHEKAAEFRAAREKGPDLEQLWDIVRTGLSNPDSSTHAKWLSDASPIELKDNVLKVAVESEQNRRWLDARFGPAISRVLELNGYPEIKVVFRAAELRKDVTSANGLRPEPRPAQTRAEKTSPDSVATPVRSPADPATPSTTGPVRMAGLNPACCFERFVVGTGNRLAHAGALAVADGLRAAYNPLFLHGGVGVGKTHLLQAITSRWMGRGQQAAYISSETFTNELIAAIRSGSTASFRLRYRQIDILLVDDIHFIAGKDSTQEEFFHTFDALYNGGKQIVLSSDRAPNELKVLEDRLRSRFSCGLMADIQPPDLLTRLEILKARVAERGRSVSEDVLASIASQSTQNVRELEGLLNRVLAMSDLHGIEPSLAIATGLASSGGRRGQAMPDDVLQAVGAYYRVTTSALRGKVRTRAISLPRHVAMFLMREDASMSLPQIGTVLGGRDHTTVMYGCARVSRQLETDEGLTRDLDAIRGLISSCGPCRV